MKRKLDLIFLIFAPLVAMSVSFLFKTPLIVSTFLFFGLPAVYLSFRTPFAVKKSLIFASLIFPVGIPLDYFTHKSGAWFVPSVFPRIFGVVPIEDLVWGFLLVYGITLFYEHFLDKGKHNLKDTHLKYLLIIIISIIIIFLITYYLSYLTSRDLFVVPYFYLFLGTVLVLLPVVSFLSFFPRLISKFVKAGVYYCLLAFLVEITALKLNHWSFVGNNFIGWVSFGGLRFPFEEFFFYILLFSTAVLSYYEFFDDDRK